MVEQLWVVLANVRGGSLEDDAAGAYANIVVSAPMIEDAIALARRLCSEESFELLEILLCRQFNPYDDEDDVGEHIRTCGYEVFKTRVGAFARLDVYPPDTEN